MSVFGVRPERLAKPTPKRPSRAVGFPPTVRALVAARSEGWCEVCGAEPAAQLHHRRPRGLGGTRDATTNSAANSLAVCGACHDVIEGRSVLHPQRGRVRGSRVESERNGWLISRLTGDEPDEVPVWTAAGWVQLGMNGDKRRIEAT